MKKVGLIIFAFGLLVTIFTGLNYVTKEVVINSGDVSITKDVNHGFSWSPLIGIAILTVGVILVVLGFKRQKNVPDNKLN